MSPPPFFFPSLFLNSDSSLWEGLSVFSPWNSPPLPFLCFLRYKRGFVFSKDKQGDGQGSPVPFPRLSASFPEKPGVRALTRGKPQPPQKVSARLPAGVAPPQLPPLFRGWEVTRCNERKAVLGVLAGLLLSSELKKPGAAQVKTQSLVCFRLRLTVEPIHTQLFTSEINMLGLP